MKVKSIITGAIAVLTAAGMLFVYSNSFAVKARVASLSNVKGKVTVKKAGTSEWVAAADRMELREGDELIVMGTPAQIEAARRTLSAPE